MIEEIKDAVNEATKVDVWVYDIEMPSFCVLEKDFQSVKRRVTVALEIAIKQRNHFAANYNDFTPFDEAIGPFDKDIIEALRS